MKGRAGKRKVKRVVFLAVAVPVLALLGYAWTDGGREPLRDIVEPIAVPRPLSGNAK